MVTEGRLTGSIFSLTALKVGGRFYLWFPIAWAQVLTRGDLMRINLTRLSVLFTGKHVLLLG